MTTSAPRGRQIAAAVVGNALEWYDFGVYGFLSVVIARLFFPAGSEYAALLLAFATFGAGFVMRPVGAVVLGLYADRHGRKAGMQLVILLMTIAVGLIALAPTYASIGLGAPLLMLLARLLQGFATGGEFSSSTSFLVETAPAHRRGLYGSLQNVGQGLSALGGTAAGALVTRALTPEQLDSWGWRMPFLIGLLIGPVGYYIRRHVAETDEFLDAARKRRAPVRLRELLQAHPREVGAVFLLVVCGTTAYYVVLLYMPTYAKLQLALPVADAFLAQVLALAWLVVLVPIFGALSDHIGRRGVIGAAALAYFLLPYPLLAWAHAAPSFERLLVMQLALCTAIAAYFGPVPTTLAEQFPARVRSSGLAIAYNFAVAIFGGFAPFVITWLMQETALASAPALYVMLGAAAGLAGVCLIAPTKATVA